MVIELGDYGCLGMVLLETLLEGLLVVIWPLYQVFTGHVIFALDLGGFELDVVGSTGSLMDSPP